MNGSSTKQNTNSFRFPEESELESFQYPAPSPFNYGDKYSNHRNGLFPKYSKDERSKSFYNNYDSPHLYYIYIYIYIYILFILLCFRKIGLGSCSCKKLVNEEGYGNCKKVFNKGPICYVHQPSTCHDIIEVKGGIQASWEACKNTPRKLEYYRLYFTAIHIKIN